MLTLTLTQVQEQQEQQLESLVEAAGSPAHLAKMLNIHSMTVRGWIARKRISKEGATLVESHPSLGEYYTASLLRPDVYHNIEDETSTDQ